MIIALAGRRVDAIDATQSKFPLQNVDRVSRAVRALFELHQVTAVVSSAACGADLIGLAEAGKLGLRRRIVLPFDRAKFRETSVIDRPGDWAALYDKILDEVESRNDLTVVNTATHAEPYSMVNGLILADAVSLGREEGEPVNAALVWDGISRGKQDFTDELGVEARKLGLAVLEVLTI